VQEVVSGNQISGSLTGWGYDYAKYRLQLSAGDVIEVTDPPDSELWVTLVNSNGSLIANAGGGLYEKVFTEGAVSTQPQAATHWLVRDLFKLTAEASASHLSSYKGHTICLSERRSMKTPITIHCR
jgi:hypothetical protein